MDMWSGHASPIVENNDVWAGIASPALTNPQNSTNIIPNNKGDNFEKAIVGVGQSAQAGLEGLGSLYDVARMPFNAMGANIPTSTDIIRAHSPFPTPDNLASDLTRGSTSALSSLLTGSGLAESSAPLLANVGKALVANPASQIGGFATSEAARGATKRAGFGEGAQLAAGLAGAVPGMMAGNFIDTAAKPLVGQSLQLLENNAAEAPSSSADAKAISKQFYDKANESGGTLTPDFTNSLINKVSNLAPQTAEGKITVGNTPLTDLAERWQKLQGKPLSLHGVQEMDEGLGDLIDNQYSNGRLSKQGRQLLDVQSTFRDMINRAAPEHVEGGSQGFEALANGRSAWHQGAKMSDVERLIIRAENSDNPSTAIKSGVRTMLSNPARTRGWNDEELAALKDAGDRGAFGGLLHVFGSRLGPIITAGAGVASGNPFLGMAAAGANYGLSTGMRNLSTQMQMNRAQNVLDVLGKGVPQ